ncbi:Lrp/AsnC family transcriptional regulator [Luteipulveratus halotolerans]|uniref:Lrp/AsnC family transcriptional regulator n=1 Tax=Luteipulveratus halotolerans TaxID=1631356 RepID=UPI0009E40B51|nr:Lrp/AsnC family transcriptional regulator [Luteipulveratus halotolerans]
MEALDRQIVQLLAGDGRMSYTDLGRRTGLSTSAVHQRVRRLEERGVIRAYRAVVDHDQAQVPMTALISVTPFDPAAPDDVPDRLRHMAAIDSCFSVAGDESYVLKVRVGGPGELEDLLADIRGAASVTTRTTVVLSTPWEDRSPLSAEVDGRIVPAPDATSADPEPAH